MDDPPETRRIDVREWTGNAFVYAAPPPPQIPDGKGRDCPQCGESAWAGSRWCWSCKWDFDRAELPKAHPSKLLAFSLAFNVLLAILSLALAITRFAS